MTTLQEALDKCERVAIESGAHESYGACRDAFKELRAALAQPVAHPRELSDEEIDGIRFQCEIATTRPPTNDFAQRFARAVLKKASE